MNQATNGPSGARKKILYIITKSNWGGAQRYVFDLATNIPKDSFDVAVVLGGSGPLKQKLNAAGVRTISVDALQRDVSLSKEFKAMRELASIFKNEKPDVVHLNSSKAGGLGALAARLAGIRKIIFTVHGLPEDESRSPLSRLLIKIATKLTFFLCTDIIAVSKNNFDRIHSRKAHLIYNGIDPNIHFGSGDIVRSKFPSGVKIIGTVGELTKNKNQIALIQQARKDPSMYVAIVGEGEDRAMLEQKIKEYGLAERVKLFGFIPASEALKGFDIFALPSLKEGLPYVLLEAKLAGLPIEANRVGGVSEILDAKDLSKFSLKQMVTHTIALY
jgi:glycosyltransferase involved in cell wall biosynthesis